MYVVHGPISMRRMKSMGQEALSLPCVWVASICEPISYELVPTGEYIARFLDLSSHFGKATHLGKQILVFSRQIKGLEKIMSNVAIVYHSGFGHTQALAEAVAKGVQAVSGAKASLVPVAEAEARAAALDAAGAPHLRPPAH